MTKDEVLDVTEKIAALFPNMNPAISGALAQELSTGNYDPLRVMVWANARRTETTLFNLDELRTKFKADQQTRAKEPDHATQAYQRQRTEVQAGAKFYSESADFCSHLSDEEYASLRAEVIASMPEKIRPIADRVGRNHGLITSAIFELVKKQSAGYEVK